ncbi:hypothetical protein NXS19_005182 [Fusarium pseudograminearum]|nr:hypothetical protein NXS19_005182 [Fusarium pseudograminearum]
MFDLTVILLDDLPRSAKCPTRILDWPASSVSDLSGPEQLIGIRHHTYSSGMDRLTGLDPGLWDKSSINAYLRTTT